MVAASWWWAGRSVTTVELNGDGGVTPGDLREFDLYVFEQDVALKPVNQRGWTPVTSAQGVFYANLGRRWPDMGRWSSAWAPPHLRPASPR